MTRSDATGPTGTRCLLFAERDAGGLYRLTCSCGAVRAIYSARDAAIRKANRYGDDSGHGYSITNR